MNVREKRKSSKEALADLLEALASIAPIAEVVPTLWIERSDAYACPLEPIALAYGINNLRTSSCSRFYSLADDVATRRLAPSLNDLSGQILRPGDIESAISDQLAARWTAHSVRSSDRTSLRAYSRGTAARQAVVLVGACGMPIQLLDAWASEIAKTHFVVAWETRALFPPLVSFNAKEVDVASQVDDLRAVMDRADIQEAHVVGLCGGAVIALEAAVALPSRIRSLSVWHGDFFGSESTSTTHQRDVAELLAMARRSPDDASAIRQLLHGSPSVREMRRDLAPIALYPYVTDELLFRYSHLNGCIMKHDLRPNLHRISQFVNVITSQGDTTAHPDGSRDVALRLPHARFTELSIKDHLSLFDFPAEYIESFNQIMAEDAA